MATIVAESPIAEPQVNAAAFSGHCSLMPSRSDLASDLWVRLRVLPHPFSSNYALLMGQIAPEAWSVWIPNYGEATVCVDALGEVCPPGQICG